MKKRFKPKMQTGGFMAALDADREAGLEGKGAAASAGGEGYSFMSKEGMGSLVGAATSMVSILDALSQGGYSKEPIMTKSSADAMYSPYSNLAYGGTPLFSHRMQGRRKLVGYRPVYELGGTIDDLDEEEYNQLAQAAAEAGVEPEEYFDTYSEQMANEDAEDYAIPDEEATGYNDEEDQAVMDMMQGGEEEGYEEEEYAPEEEEEIPMDEEEMVDNEEEEQQEYGKGGWIRKAAASIKRRGTKGKCTPITKPGCTGRARALAKTFKKIARNRKKHGLGGLIYQNGGEVGTMLTPQEEKVYQSWRGGLPKPLQWEGDYDLRGLWKSNPNAKPSADLHFPDTYKLPNHPTFSNESTYYDGTTPGVGGYWKEDNYVKNPRVGPPIPKAGYANGQGTTGATGSWATGGYIEPRKYQYAGYVGEEDKIKTGVAKPVAESTGYKMPVPTNFNVPIRPSMNLSALVVDPKNEIRSRLAKNLNPYGYWNVPSRLFDAVVLNRNERIEGDTVPTIDRRQQYFNKYLQQPYDEKEIRPSEYRPSKSKDPNAKYYAATSVEGDFPESINPNAKSMKDINLGEKFDSIGGNVYGSPNSELGNYTIDYGSDDRGNYLSYYDKWDLSPFGSKQTGSDQSFGIGAPFEMYNRVYYDKKTGKRIPSHAMGGTISRSKAREILHDGTAHGHPLTDKQRRYMGYMANRKRYAPGGVVVPASMAAGARGITVPTGPARIAGTVSGPSIVDFLQSGGHDSSFAYRANLAKAAGIQNYTGRGDQNTQLLNMLSGNTISPTKKTTVVTTKGGIPVRKTVRTPVKTSASKLDDIIARTVPTIPGVMSEKEQGVFRANNEKANKLWDQYQKQFAGSAAWNSGINAGPVDYQQYEAGIGRRDAEIMDYNNRIARFPPATTPVSTRGTTVVGDNTRANMANNLGQRKRYLGATGNYAYGGRARYPMGGQPQMAEAEVEGGEIIQPPGQQAMEVSGPSHEEGGVDVTVPEGTKVYSDRLKLDGKTMKQRKEAREAQINKLKKLYLKDPHNKLLQGTIEKTAQNLFREDQQDMQLQQTANKTYAPPEQQQPDMGEPVAAYGGYLKKYAGGSFVFDDDTEIDPVTGKPIPKNKVYYPYGISGSQNATNANYPAARSAVRRNVATAPRKAGVPAPLGNPTIDPWKGAGLQDIIAPPPAEAVVPGTGDYDAIGNRINKPVGYQGPENRGTGATLPALENQSDPTSPAYDPTTKPGYWTPESIDRMKASIQKRKDDQAKIDAAKAAAGDNDLTTGDYLGMAGTAFGSIASIMNTRNAAKNTPPNLNRWRGAGQRAIDTNQQAMDYASTQMGNAIGDIGTDYNTAVAANRGGALGINAQRALDTGSAMTRDKAKLGARNAYVQQMMGLLGQRGALTNQQDVWERKGQDAADLATKQDIDTYYSNMGQDLQGISRGAQVMGRNINQSWKNKADLRLANQASQYGYGLNQNMEAQNVNNLPDVDKWGYLVDENNKRILDPNTNKPIKVR